MKPQRHTFCCDHPSHKGGLAHPTVIYHRAESLTRADLYGVRCHGAELWLFVPFNVLYTRSLIWSECEREALKPDQLARMIACERQLRAESEAFLAAVTGERTPTGLAFTRSSSAKSEPSVLIDNSDP